MPTYTVTTSNLTLTKSKKKSIAQGITNIHSKTTGANTYFAQVMFLETKKNNHFMGGKLVKDEQIYLHGQIRAGRPKKIKDELGFVAKHTIKDAVQGLCEAFDKNLLPNSLEDQLYFNIKRMQNINLL